MVNYTPGKVHMASIYSNDFARYLAMAAFQELDGKPASWPLGHAIDNLEKIAECLGYDLVKKAGADEPVILNVEAA